MKNNKLKTLKNDIDIYFLSKGIGKKEINWLLLPFIIVTFIFLFVIFVVWIWETSIDTGTHIDYEAFGTFGDFIGGVIGTFFAFLGVFLVYITYKDQVTSHRKEQIETRFFELLKLHEKNVEELYHIDDDIFNLYLKNIRNFVNIIKRFSNDRSKNFQNETIVELGYLYFFYGASEYTSERIGSIQVKASDINEFNEYIKRLGIVYYGSYANFGKYFRQLFQIVSYIDGKSELNYREKEQYIKLLRVRLNIEEQYLLFLNSLVSNGLDWEKNSVQGNNQLITKYNLLKNIPKEYKQIEGIDFKVIYPNIHYEFLGNNKSEKRMILENSYY